MTEKDAFHDLQHIQRCKLAMDFLFSLSLFQDMFENCYTCNVWLERFQTFHFKAIARAQTEALLAIYLKCI